jgi:hypothetical protein
MNISAIDRSMMMHCIGLAKKSGKAGEYPYDAVVCRDGVIANVVVMTARQDERLIAIERRVDRLEQAAIAASLHEAARGHQWLCWKICCPSAESVHNLLRKMSFLYTVGGMFGRMSTPEQKCIGLSEQKCIKDAGKRPPNWGPFSSGIRLGSDCPRAGPSWRGVIGACSD